MALRNRCRHATIARSRSESMPAGWKRHRRTLHRLLVLLLASVIEIREPSAHSVNAADAGVWLLPRHDAGNTGRAELPGDFRDAPVEVWSFGSSHSDYQFFRPVTVGNEIAYLAQAGGSLELLRPSGERVWRRQAMGLTGIVDVLNPSGSGSGVALATLGDNSFALVDVATGKSLWTWSAPAGSRLGSYKLWKETKPPRLVVFPQGTVEGFCFELTPAERGPVRLVWQQNYEGKYWAAFGPSVVLADMTRCGRPDILLAGKPAYMAVIDIDTGAIKFDLAYPVPGEEHAGRPYGLLQATDLDGDGYRDAVMVSCQVEEYIGVLHNEQGAGFRFVWSRFVEHDLPDDIQEVRPNITSLADLRGDGTHQLVVGLFNLDNDQRWHTVVFDPLGGWESRLVDLPDRYFWGCVDLNGDGRPEIVTSTETSRRCSQPTTIQAVDGRSFEDVAVLENASLVTMSRPLATDQAFLANRSSPVMLSLPNGDSGLLVRRGGGESAQEVLWRLEGRESVVRPFEITPLSRTALLHDSGEPVQWVDLQLGSEAGRDESPAASGPLISQVDGRSEIVCALADGTIVGGEPDLSRPGEFRSRWRVRGSNPAIWIGLDGKRTVCALDPERDVVLLSRPELRPAGPQELQPAVREIPLPIPPLRLTGSGTADTLLPFGTDSIRLYVALRMGVHTMAGALYDESGKLLWLDEKEGPYPRRAAAADLDGDGRPTLIVDNHGKHLLYELDGTSRVIAHGWNATVPGRGDGAKYALPIVGPFGPAGETRIVMSPGLEVLEVLDGQGERLATSPYGSTYEREWCSGAVAQLRGAGAGAGEWDVGTMTSEGVFHCADLTTGRDRWELPLGVKNSVPSHIASGDLDGDGRDNFLVGLANGDLVALDERDGQPGILWRLNLESAITDIALGDIDGDGRLEIVAATDDGKVRILRPAAVAGS